MVKTVTHQVVEFTSECPSSESTSDSSKLCNSFELGCEMVVVATFRDLEERKSEQYEIALKFANERMQKQTSSNGLHPFSESNADSELEQGSQILIQEISAEGRAPLVLWRSWGPR